MFITSRKATDSENIYPTFISAKTYNNFHTGNENMYDTFHTTTGSDDTYDRFRMTVESENMFDTLQPAKGRENNVYPVLWH